MVIKVTKGEIFKTLISLVPGKSPGPDSFNVEFFKFFWNDIQEDLFKAINYFFEHVSMPNSGGLTFNALIRKKENPVYVIHHRLISLCNVSYKIIAKILANRLKVERTNWVYSR